MPKIVFLPDAGPENPFQYEMANYLRTNGHQVTIGQKYTVGSTVRAIHKHKPDILYYDWVHSFVLAKSAWLSYAKAIVFVFEIIYAKYIRRIKIVHTLHNLQNHAGLHLRLEYFVYNFFLSHCDRIRVYSENTKKVAIAKFDLDASKIAVIQDLPFHYYYDCKPSKKTVPRKNLNISQNAFIYLFFGEVKPYKGLHQLLPIFLEYAMPDDGLIVAGKSYDPVYFAQLQTLTKRSSQVMWHHRFIKDEEVPMFFNAADVVVLPFVRIDHSGSIDLAMSFSKPVITLKTEATQQLLSNQTMLLYEKPENIVDCLKIAKSLDLKSIGQSNFKVADATNYKEILNIFDFS